MALLPLPAGMWWLQIEVTIGIAVLLVSLLLEFFLAMRVACVQVASIGACCGG
jgi:hypothetical protein